MKPGGTSSGKARPGSIPPALAAAYRAGFTVHALLLKDSMTGTTAADPTVLAATHLTPMTGRLFFAVLAVTDTEGAEYPVMDVGPFATASAAHDWAHNRIGQPAGVVAPDAFDTYFESPADAQHPITGVGLTIIGPGTATVTVTADPLTA